ncbi:hypothetical protein [Aestuariispira insulae]|nr:hypothetical protein [Aestuariispira insulae]
MAAWFWRVAKWAGGVVITLVAVGSAYDYFFNPWGGIFCPTHEGRAEYKIESAYCEANSPLPATHLEYSGMYHMALLKFGDGFYPRCLWVNVNDYDIDARPVVDRPKDDPILTDSGLQHSCMEPSQVTITYHGRGPQRLNSPDMRDTPDNQE